MKKLEYLDLRSNFFFMVLGFKLWADTLSHSISPIVCDRFFQDRVSQTISLGWL
jgi:hypothetical protein